MIPLHGLRFQFYSCVMNFIEISRTNSFGGIQRTLEHESQATLCAMRVSVFTPPKPTGAGLLFLSGLTCTEENFTVKSGAQRYAAELGLTLIAPDTSPRTREGGEVVADDPAYDLGQGAGFYINATQEPWVGHFHMEDYIAGELVPAIHDQLGVAEGRLGLSGHSMGGHGALTLALKHPELFKSVSAFDPIVAPTQVPWGQKAFAAYLGEGADWRAHCATSLVEDGKRFNDEVLIDQGSADPFLEEQLKPHLFETAMKAANQPLRLEMRDGYDHSYFHISSFIGEHLAWHTAKL